MPDQLAIADQLADYVSAELARGVEADVFAESFTPLAAECPDDRPDLFQDLAVHVVPRDDEIELAGRSDLQHTLGIDIAIRKRVLNWRHGGCRPLNYLADQVRDYWKPTERRARIELPCGTVARITGIRIAPRFDPMSLRKSNLFFSIITVEFTLLT